MDESGAERDEPQPGAHNVRHVWMLLARRDGRRVILDEERMTGIEPALSAWEAEVLPLNYIRALELQASCNST